jgi:DNA-binding SARP family transcriptional activator
LTPPLQLRALGALELTRDGAPLLPGRAKPLTVLVYLARQPGRLLARATLASLFWPEATEARSRQSLRQTLTELRDALGPSLEVAAEHVVLRADAVALDATEFATDVDREDYARGLSRWRGEFLPGVERWAGEELRAWVEAEREALRRRHAYASERAIERLAAQGAWPEAAAVATRWSDAAPLSERALRRLIEMLQLEGRGAEAGAHYAAFRERLRAAGLDASAELLQLEQRLALDATTTRDAGLALLSPDLVGRDAAFASLTDAWRRAVHDAAVVTIEGESGCGKTRLLEDWLRWVRQSEPRAVVCYTRGFEAERGVPGALLRHLLAPLAGAAGIATAAPAALRTVAELIPEFAHRFARGPAPERVALGDAVSAVLGAVRADQRVLVAVDDAGAADDVSREVLEQLARRPPAGVMLVLVSPPDTIARTAPALRRIILGLLSASETEALLASMAEFQGADRRRLVARLHEATRGNPLAIVETVRSLAEAGAIAPQADGSWTLRHDVDTAPLPVPPTVRETMLARLEGLEPDARAVLEAAVVLDRALDPTLLLGLTRFASHRLDRALEALVKRRLLRDAADGSGRLELAHDVLRRTVYDSIPPLRRREWHRRAYDALRQGRGRPRDSVARALLAQHRERGGRGAAPRWRHWSVWAGGALVLAAGAVWWRTRPEGPQAARRIAVAPFSVQGDTSLRFLGTAIAELIASGLDGAGGLHAVRPGEGATDATFRIDGHVVVLDSGLTIRAALHRGTRGAVLVEAAAQGPVPAALQLSRDIARQLLTSRALEAEATTGVLGWVRTGSLDALREYLDGERLFRSFEIPEAVQAYRRATLADTGFSVAWYRIGESALWLLRNDVARIAADSALRHARRLYPDEVDHLLAFQALVQGRIRDAEARLQGSSSLYPRQTESRYLLADVRFHYYWLRGATAAQAQSLFRAVHRDAPGDWRPLFHLWDLAVKAGDVAEAEAIRQLLGEIAPQAEFFSSFDFITRYARAPEPERAALLDSLQLLDQWGLGNLIRRYATLTRDVAGVTPLATLLTRPDRPADVRATGHLFRGIAALAGGRFAAARTEATRAASLSPITVYQWTALVTSPGLPESPGLRAERLRLQSVLTPLAPRSLLVPYYPWTDFDRRDAADLYPYVRGRLALSLGDTAGARAWLDRLSRRRDATVLRPVLTATLAGALAAAAGDSAGALRLLDSAFARVPIDHTVMSVFATQPGDRYLFARSLIASGRAAEALAWLEGIGDGSVYDLALLAPAQLARARLLDAAGARAAARSADRNVRALYRDADTDWRALADTAR